MPPSRSACSTRWPTAKRPCPSLPRPPAAPNAACASVSDVLVSLGVLIDRRGGGRYRFHPSTTRPAFRPRALTYKGNAVLLATFPDLYQAWSRAAEAVRHGGTMLESHGLSPGHRFWETYAEVLRGFTSMNGRVLAEALPQRELGCIVDVASGSRHGRNRGGQPAREKRGADLDRLAQRARDRRGQLFQVRCPDHPAHPPTRRCRDRRSWRAKPPPKPI